MTKRDTNRCPIAYGLDIFGDRWTLLVLRDMIFREKTTFSSFQKSHEKIASNILADRLSRLETAGLIQKRRPGKGHPSYHLTAEGAGLIPVVVEIIAFSAAHGGYEKDGILHGAPPDLLDRFARDRDALLAELTAHALA